MGSVVAGEGPTAYLLAFFRWDFSDPFDVCLGYPVLRYPTSCLSQTILNLISFNIISISMVSNKYSIKYIF